MTTKDGRIKVYIRSRPLFSNESQDVFTYSETSLQSSSKLPSSFVFDRVFSPQTSNDQIYQTVARPNVEAAANGYNSTIFAYGQTTSGKTHTMVGSDTEPGIIPRGIHDLFQILNQSNSDFSVWVSFLEIYNETINDLLSPGNNNLKIREDPAEGCFVAGLRQAKVQTMEQALEMLEFGEKQRRYRSTRIHEHSSRSHCVFRLLIETTERMGSGRGEDKQMHLKGTVRFSVLNLVDLAGSERTNEVGDTSETSYINKSLFVLTNVIKRLAENQGQHIPFRDSKLTRILSNALGGNSLTSLICTIAPDVKNFQMSVLTLRFASRAKNIRISAQVNEMIDDSKLLSTYRIKIQNLESKIAQISRQSDQEQRTLKAENAKLREMLKQSSSKTQRVAERRNSQDGDNKENALFGFDELKIRYETENINKVQKCDIWESECALLREQYIIDLQLLHGKYWDFFNNIINSDSEIMLPKIPNSSNTTPSKPSNSRQSRPSTNNSRRPFNKRMPEPRNYPVRIDQNTISRPGTRNTVRVNTQQQNPRSSSQAGQERAPVKRQSQPIVRRRIVGRENELSQDSPYDEIPTSLTQTALEDSPTSSLDPFHTPQLSSSQAPALPEPMQLQSDSTSEDERETAQTDSLERFRAHPNEIAATESQGAVESEILPGENMLIWGLNNEGSCGIASNTTTSRILSLPMELEQISCGASHTAAIDKYGVLYTLGKGKSGQLGTGSLKSTNVLTPVTHPLNHVPVAIVACGWQFTLCVTNDNRLFSWGNNSEGQLGLGDLYDRCRPTQVKFSREIINIAGGRCHSALITDNGKLYTWGGNPDGRLFLKPVQLRHQVYKRIKIPTCILEIRNAKQVALGNSHTVVLLNDGSVHTSGSTEFGQLGIGANYDYYRLNQKLSFFGSDVIAQKVSAGDGFSAILTEQGQIYTFGRGSYGRLGHGGTANELMPRQVNYELKITDICCGGRHMLAIDSSGELLAWGHGFYNQLALFNGEDHDRPTNIDLSRQTGKWVKSIACGQFHSACNTI